MKTSTKVVLGAAAGVGLLYVLGKSKLTSACAANIGGGLQLATEFVTGQQVCQTAIDQVPFFTTVKIGFISIYREPTPADLT